MRTFALAVGLLLIGCGSSASKAGSSTGTSAATGATGTSASGSLGASSGSGASSSSGASSTSSGSSSSSGSSGSGTSTSSSSGGTSSASSSGGSTGAPDAGAGCLLSLALAPTPFSGTSDKAGELSYVENLINQDNNTTGWRFAAVRLYASWAETLFNASATPPNGGTFYQRFMHSGHSLLLSIKPSSGAGSIPSGLDTTGVWNAIAAGTADADLARQVSELQALVTSSTWNPDARIIYLTYHHEMDGDGSASAYVPMFRHVVDYYQAHMSAAARARVRWVWDPTTFGFTAASGPRAPAYYPGDAYVDYVASDGYDRMPANNDAPTAHAGTYSNFGSDVADPAYDDGQSIFDVQVSWTRANTGATPGPSGLPPSAFGSKLQQIWEWGVWPMVLPPATFPGASGTQADFGSSTLSAALTASATSMTVARASSGGTYYFPKKGPYVVIVEPGTSAAERIEVGHGGTSAVSGNTLQNLHRTSGRAHANGATVVLAEDVGNGTGTGMRARFIQNAALELQQHWTDVKLISYFNVAVGQGGNVANQEWPFYARLSVNEGNGGTQWVEDADSHQAFAAMAANPYFASP